MAWARAYLVRLFQPLPREQVEAIAQAIALQPDVLWAQPDYIAPDPAHAERPAVREPVALLRWRPAKSAARICRTRGTARPAGPAFARRASTPARCSTHPDLASRFVGGYDFVDRGQPPINPNDGDGRDPDASDPGDWVAASNAVRVRSIRAQNSTLARHARRRHDRRRHEQRRRVSRASTGSSRIVPRARARQVRRLDERHRRCAWCGRPAAR